MTSQTATLHWKNYLELCKPRVVALIVFTAIVGMLLAVPGLPPLADFLYGTIGIALAASSAAAINHFIDQKADAEMARTKHRPLPTGELSSHHVLIFAAIIGALAMALLILKINALTAFLTFLSLIGYAVIYTVYLKKMTPQNIVIGGIAGAAPPLLGWTAITGEIHPHALLLVLIIFVWTPPHFWALAALRQEDYRRAGIPMLPVVTGPETWGPVIFIHVAVLVVLSLGPVFYGLGPVYWLCAAGGGLWFLATSWRLTNQPSKQAARSTFRASLGQFALLSLGVVLDRGLAWAF